MKPTVYLAGPIVGCTESEAKDWRKDVTLALAVRGITGISPLRCEPPASGALYDLTYPDAKFGTARAITSKNVFDVKRCDFTLVYLPKEAVERKAPYGTVCELAWASMLGKGLIVVTDAPEIIQHPLLNSLAGWLLPTLDDAIEVLVGVLGDYARPA